MKENHINYIEFKAKNIQKIKEFYTNVFQWEFVDFGPSYASFSKSGLAGGFEFTESEIVNGVLVVLYHKNLDQLMKSIIEQGGKITKNIFTFPGGKRFHFSDPSGNELAVWSE